MVSERLGRHLIEQQQARQAHHVWLKVVSHISRVLPQNSDEKVVYFDELAQVRIMMGDVQGLFSDPSLDVHPCPHLDHVCNM